MSLFFSGFMFLLCFIMLPITFYVVQSNSVILITWSVSILNSCELNLPLVLDLISCIFCMTVLFISGNVLLFAKSYMQDELYLKRFIILVMLFVLSMNLLIFIPNLITLLIGWDGLGITSFILVIYYQNAKSLGAGMITALTNRIGDVLILLSIALMLNSGHWNVLSMWTMDHLYSTNLIILLLMCAAMTKSAQIPFSSWLPAAMAAPTPVSALVHSSTLVTAGIFLLIRFYPFLSHFNYFNFFLLIMSTLTMTMAGCAAVVETDMKKIIALSTLSQLGVMMSSIAMGMPMLAFFHLVTHALFKALLFICAGTLIHTFHHSQDMRYMGMLSSQMPLTTSTLLCANLALCGFPFMAGFYSKDLIIEMTLYSPMNMLITSLYVIATMLTVAYSLRFSINVIYSSHMSPSLQYTTDEDIFTTTPMLLLSLGAIVGGSLMNWIILDPFSHPIIPTLTKLSPLLMTIISFIITLEIMNKPSVLTTALIPMTHLNASMWFLTPISSQGMLKSSLLMAHHLLKSLDQSWVETSGAQGINSSMINLAAFSQPLSNNVITLHIMLILMSTFMFMI
nr:NADH dehydrogenase subunit 5 [Arichlidon gathofi]